MTRKLIITVEDLSGVGLMVKVEGSGFNSLEIVGILEHTKADVQKRMTSSSKPSGDKMAQFLGMIAGMSGHHDDDQN